MTLKIVRMIWLTTAGARFEMMLKMEIKIKNIIRRKILIMVLVLTYNELEVILKYYPLKSKWIQKKNIIMILMNLIVVPNKFSSKTIHKLN